MLIDNIQLPDFDWIDEFGWCSVVQSQKYSINGSLFIQEGMRMKGRPLTFNGGENKNLITRAQVELLYASQNTLNHLFTITLSDSRVFNVRWRNSEGNAVEVVPFVTYNFTSTNLYVVESLKFLEV